MSWIHPELPKPEAIYRHDDAGTRFYAHVDDTGRVHWMPSVTSVIKDTQPTPIGLLQWYAKHGVAEANRLRDEAAEYGTALHIAIADYCMFQPVNPTSERMTKDLMAWHAFATERDVMPLAVEVPLFSTALGVAGTADLVCHMNWNGKQVLAMIDIKSGGAYDDHAIQLAMYQSMWNAQYPDHKVTHIFNWYPKDWTKKPTYTLTDRTGDMTLEVSLRCALWHERYKAGPRPRMTVSGTIARGADMPTVEWSDPDAIAREKFSRMNATAITDDDVVMTDDDVVWGHA